MNWAIRIRLSQGARVNNLGDWIYGAMDDGLTTFAIVPGVVRADLLASVVLLLGFGNLVIDGFAMAGGQLQWNEGRS